MPSAVADNPAVGTFYRTLMRVDRGTRFRFGLLVVASVAGAVLCLVTGNVVGAALIIGVIWVLPMFTMLLAWLFWRLLRAAKHSGSPPRS